MLSLSFGRRRSNQPYDWHGRLADGHVDVNDYSRCLQLLQMTKTLTVRALLWEVADDTAVRRYRRKQEYQLQAFTEFFTSIWEYVVFIGTCFQKF
jgi:hypothetical protein